MIDTTEVTHVTFSSLGGAGAVAVRLANAQQALGWKAGLSTLVETPFPQWAWKHPVIATSAIIDDSIVRKYTEAAFFSLFRNQHAASLSHQLAQREGVLHLHWLPGFIWPPALFTAPLKARKLIWSIQDLWPFTGGCHFANECTEFTKNCENCPQVRPTFQPLVAAALRRKQEGYRGKRDLLVVAPSEWTRSLIQASSAMRDHPSAVIPNPVDTSLFVPKDRAAIRAKLGMNPAAFVVGVGAANLRDERKQIQQTLTILNEWISQSDNAIPIQVLVFGSGGPFPNLSPAFHFVGSSGDAATLADWYNAMDVYVSLSRYETFGNTLAEAASCGIPAICLTGSGMTEVVIPDQTGRHVHLSEELPSALSCLMKNHSLTQQMGIAARENAVRRFDDRVIAQQFIALYQE